MTGSNKLLRSLYQNSVFEIEAELSGSVPDWLEGTLFRNGPGRYQFGNKVYKHLFDGQSCVHKFKITGGKVLYSNRILETNSYVKTTTENRLYPVFGTPDLCSSK